jgi:flagellar motor switch protein FliM
VEVDTFADNRSAGRWRSWFLAVDSLQEATSMGDVLSQSEVESLLQALDPAKNSGSGPPVREHNPVAHSFGQISVYDFKRPERVSKDQMRAFQAMHEGFSREFGAAMSAMLRTIVEVKLISVDQLTYSEFVFSLENPTCFNLLRSEGLEGHLILDLNPSIVFPIVDRLLGGGKFTGGNLPRRPLTDIENRLASRITELAIASLANSWRKLCDLKLRVTQVESNPQLVQIVPPNEVIVLISFELTMGDIRGIVNLCIPYNTIEPLAGKLSANTWSSYTQKQLEPRQRLQLEAGVQSAAVEMVVRLATTRISAGELLDLDVGDVIMTEQDVKSPLQVLVEGRAKFIASAGLLKGHKAVKIDGQLERKIDEIDRKLARESAR